MNLAFNYLTFCCLAYLLLLLLETRVGHGLFLDNTSCVGICNRTFNSNYPCQCNKQCQQHNDCCPDYTTECLTGPITCSTSFNDVTERLWKDDVNRLKETQYTVNYQAQVPSNNTADLSRAPFFTHVDESYLASRPTFRAFEALQDNYHPASGQADPNGSAQDHEINVFLDAILRTSVMQHALTYFKCKNIVHDETSLRAQLRSLWFTPYARQASSTVKDSSGFEHVMVGEYKGTTQVNGLHNWLAYYLKEKAHEINYQGYVKRGSPNLVALNFAWNGRRKELGTFFLGVSPEFEMAFYTLCALTHSTTASLNGQKVGVQIYDMDRVSGFQIGSAYVIL